MSFDNSLEVISEKRKKFCIIVVIVSFSFLNIKII